MVPYAVSRQSQPAQEDNRIAWSGPLLCLYEPGPRGRWNGPIPHRPHGDHGGPEPYSAIFVVRLDSVEELPHAREIADFTTVAGKTLSPRAMRGLYVVDEIAVGATA